MTIVQMVASKSEIGVILKQMKQMKQIKQIKQIKIRQIKFLLVVVALSSMLFAEFSHAALDNSQKIQSREYGADVAKSVAILLKTSKNLKGFLGKLRGYYTAEDIKETKDLLLSQGFLKV